MADDAARYLEHPFDPRLAGHVEALWSVRLADRAAPVDHPVLPDGCIDILLRPDRAPTVVGPMTRPERVRMAPGEVVRGLRFRPGAAAATLGLEAAELRDDEVPLAELWGMTGGLAEPLDPAALEALVARRLRPVDPLVQAAVVALGRAPATDIRGLAAALGLSERQLRRRFQATVGYGPKRLARVFRLQHLLREARRAPDATGAELAFAAGFADQAHMARETRALASAAPGPLLAGRVRSVQDTAG